MRILHWGEDSQICAENRDRWVGRRTVWTHVCSRGTEVIRENRNDAMARFTGDSGRAPHDHSAELPGTKWPEHPWESGSHLGLMALFTSTKLALLSLSIMAMLKQSRQEGNAIQETGIPAAKSEKLWAPSKGTDNGIYTWLHYWFPWWRCCDGNTQVSALLAFCDPIKW